MDETTSQKTISYLRVSTIDQDLEKNKADILHLAHEKRLGKVKFVQEKISGAIPWRQRKVGKVVNQLKKGDALIVSELSRLGRSMLECMEILSIAAQKGIRVYSVKGNWQLDGSIQSKIIAMAFSMAAEIERDLISKRTIEALRAKKAQGVTLGRPKGSGSSKLDPVAPKIQTMLNKGATKRAIANRFSTTESNLYVWLKKREALATA
ncbi:MAG: recombinase family protein [Gammaproteobacteria bacterium]|nr:recombinase family protein [Gammaproteobacteria bacterium]